MSKASPKPFGCLGFSLWCLPSVITPFVQAKSNQDWEIGASINILIVLLIGWLWGKSANFSTHDGSGYHLEHMWMRISLFTLAQVIIIPIFWFTIIYGYCAITGTNTF